MRRISSIIILLLAVALAVPSASQAQPAGPSPEDIEKAKQAYLEGKRLIDDEGNVVAGVEKFKESYRLSRNPVLLYNIAFALDGVKQRNMALFYYRKFLADAPEGAPNRDIAAERIKVLEAMPEPADPSTDPFADTEQPATGTATATGETPEPPKPEKPIVKETPKPPRVAVTTFEHKVIEEAPPHMPLDLTVAIPDDARWQVKLFYRGAGTSDFVTAGLTRRYSELIGRIPASAVSGTSIQYYIEARDSSGKVVARSGRATSPNLVFVDPAAKPRYYDDLEDDGSSTPGSGPVAGGGAIPGGGGPSDIPRDTLTYLKWGTTAGSATFLTMAVTFYFISSSAASSLEGEAFNSSTEGCQMGAPCRPFSDTQRDLQSRGETFETMTNVTMVLGLAAGAAAGYFWYKDLQRAKKKRNADQPPVRNRPPVEDFAAVPMVGPDFIGGAAAVRF